MLCIKALLRQLCGDQDAATSGGPATQTACSRMQEIPIERIFGSPQKYTEHRCHKEATSTSGVTSVISKAPLDEASHHSTEQCGMDSPCADADPALQFAVLHDVRHSALHLFLLKAANLPKLTTIHRRTEDEGVFVTAYLHPTKERFFESQVVSMSQHPVFEEAWELSDYVPLGSIPTKSLVFLVYKGTKTSRTFFGSVVLPLGDADLYGMPTTMKIDETGENLPHDLKGDVLLSCTYNPTSQLLQGAISRIANMHTSGLTDTCVKVYLAHKGVRQAKWKTSVKKNTLTPVFNECFKFDISGMDTQDISLEVVVWNYKHRESIGEVFIGEQVSTESGRSHWAEVTGSSPHVPINYWHSIK